MIMRSIYLITDAEIRFLFMKSEDTLHRTRLYKIRHCIYGRRKIDLHILLFYEE